MMRTTNRRRAGTLALLAGLLLLTSGLLAGPALAATSPASVPTIVTTTTTTPGGGFMTPPGVNVTAGGENCNGVVPTPGNENTDKTLGPSDLSPGGTANYTITFPTSAANIGDFQIVDCVLFVPDGKTAKDYSAVLAEATFSFANNAAEFSLNFGFKIPDGAANGDQICNVAKTTQSPSK